MFRKLFSPVKYTIQIKYPECQPELEGHINRERAINSTTGKPYEFNSVDEAEKYLEGHPFGVEARVVSFRG